MIKIWTGRYKKFLVLVGPRVWNKIRLAIFIGAVWFLVDMSFVYVIQAFLVCLKLVDRSQLSMPGLDGINAAGAVFLLILFGFFRATLSALKYFVTSMVAEDFSAHGRKMILKISLLSNQNFTSSEALRLFNSGVSGAASFIQALIGLFILSVAGGFYVIVGTLTAPIEFWLGLISFFIFIHPLRWLEARQREASTLANREANLTYENLVVSLRNLFLLKIYGKQKEFYQKGATSIESYQKGFRTFFLILGLKGSYPLFVGTCIISFLTYIGVEHLNTPGVKLFAVFYIFLRVSQVASDGAAAIAQLRFYFPFIKEVYSYIGNSRLGQVLSTKQEEIFALKSLRVQDLSFSYNERDSLFKELNFDLKIGDILVIHGRSGSGKSTMTMNIAGLLQPTTGNVFVDGRDIFKENLSLSPCLAHVGVDPFIIPGTVKENLIYPNSPNEISVSNLWTALKKVSADDFVQKLPEGIETFLNENTQLSTGQKQRLALARALVRKPFLLIMDEATANLDPQTELEIKNTILQESKERITIIISHKASLDDLASKRIHLG